MPYKDEELGKLKAKERYWKNREKRLAKVKEYYEKNKESINKKRRENTDYARLYRENRERYLADHKKYCNSEKGKITRRKWENNRIRNDANFILKKKARDVAKYLPLKECCELCGSKEKLQHHHPDYNKPKEVMTLCEKCHYNKIHVVERL